MSKKEIAAKAKDILARGELNPRSVYYVKDICGACAMGFLYYACTSEEDRPAFAIKKDVLDTLEKHGFDPVECNRIEDYFECFGRTRHVVIHGDMIREMTQGERLDHILTTIIERGEFNPDGEVVVQAEPERYAEVV